MEHSKTKGSSMILWIIIVAIIAVAAYFVFIRSSRQTDVTSSVSDGSNIPDNITHTAPTNSEPIARNSIPNAPVAGSNSSSCDAHISAREISDVFGYSETVTIKIKKDLGGDCILYWARKAADLTDYSEDGHLSVSTKGDSYAIDAYKKTCADKIKAGTGRAAGIGSESCIFSNEGIMKDRVLDLLKNGVTVTVAYDGYAPEPSLRAKYLTRLAEIIAGRI